MPSNLELTTHLFIQLAVILTCCRLVGVLLRRLGQTQVVADMVSGFLLGPSLLGLFFPGVMDWLFPRELTFTTAEGVEATITHPSLQILYVAGQLGLVFYMFIVGLTFDTSLLSKHRGQALYTSVAGVLTPIVLGGVVGWALVSTGGYFTTAITPWQGALFVGAALAITAFPMLARIIHDSGLSKTRIGTVALAAAAADDAAAWLLLAMVISVAANSPATMVIAVGGTVGYLVVILAARRPVLGPISRWGAARTRGHAQVLPAAVVLLLLCAAFTEWIGIYSVFGAFLIGAVIPRGEFTERVRGWLEPMTSSVLLPMFFVYAGLNTSLGLLGDPETLVVFFVVLVIAVVGKGGAVLAVALRSGTSRRDAVSLAALMNARGLMELILLNIGMEQGLITPQLYTILALMTIVTTLAASPVHFFAQRRRPDPPLAAGNGHGPIPNGHAPADRDDGLVPNHSSVKNPDVAPS